MDQIQSFKRLSVAGCTACNNIYALSCSCSELIDNLENEAVDQDLGSLLSSRESTPVMTPETSDDEDDDGTGDLLTAELAVTRPYDKDLKELLRNARTRFQDEVKDKNELDTSGSSSKWNDSSATVFRPRYPSGSSLATGKPPLDGQAKVLRTPGTSSEHYKDGETHSLPPYDGTYNLDPFEAEHEDPVDSPILGEPIGVKTSHDTLIFPDSLYGSRLSTIRAIDKIAVNDLGDDMQRERTRGQTRIMVELKAIHDDETIPYISVAPIDGNIENCLACLEGSPGTPLEGGIFWLHIEYPARYPMIAPVITLLTPVYHPNIDEKGRICIDLLESSWSPCLQTRPLLLSILSVLHNPVLKDALIEKIAEKYQEDHRDYCEIARLYTEEFAHDVRPDTSVLLNHDSIDST